MPKQMSFIKKCFAFEVYERLKRIKSHKEDELKRKMRETVNSELDNKYHG
jgi:hypothetical protein